MFGYATAVADCCFCIPQTSSKLIMGNKLSTSVMPLVCKLWPTGCMQPVNAVFLSYDVFLYFYDKLRLNSFLRRLLIFYFFIPLNLLIKQKSIQLMYAWLESWYYFRNLVLCFGRMVESWFRIDHTRESCVAFHTKSLPIHVLCSIDKKSNA